MALKTPPWWDREFDTSGKQIRDDVRQSAIGAWKDICKMVEHILGSDEEAPQLLGRSVEVISRYLNEKTIGPHDPTGLLKRDVYRSAIRLAKRQRHRRLEFIGGTSELSKLLGTPDWTDEVERRMFLAELVSFVTPETAGLVRFRMEGLEWEEIAAMLNRDAASLRRSFWKELRRAHLRLLTTPGGKKR